MEKLTIKKYAVKHKKSIFAVMKMVKENKLASETIEENGKEVLYILLDETVKIEQLTEEKKPTRSLEERVKVLEEQVVWLQKALQKQVVL